MSAELDELRAVVNLLERHLEALLADQRAYVRSTGGFAYPPADDEVEALVRRRLDSSARPMFLDALAGLAIARAHLASLTADEDLRPPPDTSVLST